MEVVPAPSLNWLGTAPPAGSPGDGAFIDERTIRLRPFPRARLDCLPAVPPLSFPLLPPASRVTARSQGSGSLSNALYIPCGPCIPARPAPEAAPPTRPGERVPHYIRLLFSRAVRHARVSGCVKPVSPAGRDGGLWRGEDFFSRRRGRAWPLVLSRVGGWPTETSGFPKYDPPRGGPRGGPGA